MVVAGEFVLVPLALALPLYALVSLLCYAGGMALRIPAENAVLSPVTQTALVEPSARVSADSEPA